MNYINNLANDKISVQFIPHECDISPLFQIFLTLFQIKIETAFQKL